MWTTRHTIAAIHYVFFLLITMYDNHRGVEQKHESQQILCVLSNCRIFNKHRFYLGF